MRWWAWLGLALGGALLAYFGALSGGFVFDDVPLLVTADCHRGLHKIPAMFSGEGLCSQRPMRFVSFALEHAVWGQDPMGFHLTNVLLHGLVVFVAGGLLWRLTEQPFVALAGAALFAWHPIATESVAYISGRRDLLMGLFCLLAVHAWLSRRHLLMLLATGAALLSHESAAALPLVLFGLIVVQEEKERRRWLWLGVAFAAVGAFALWTITAHNSSQQQALWGGSLAAHVGTVLHGHLHYLQQLFVPLWLQADYSPSGFPIATGLLEPGPLAGGFAMLAILALSLALWRRAPLVSLALWSYLMLLLPSSQLVPHHELLAEHRLYLPSLCFCALVAGGLSRLGPARVPLAAVLAIAALALTWTRVPDWQDEESLWAATLEVAPKVARAHANMGALRAEQKRIPEAFAHPSMALEIRPDLCHAWLNRGLLLSLQGQAKHAANDLAKAWACSPKARWRVPVGRGLLRDCRLQQARGVLPRKDPAWAHAYARCGPE